MNPGIVILKYARTIRQEEKSIDGKAW